MHTEEELLLEFFEDKWESDPYKAVALLGTYEDDIVLETGDAEFDEIERRLAKGEDPDEVLKGWGEGEGGTVEASTPLSVTKDAKEERRADVEEEFNDDYTLTEEPPAAGLSWSRKE